MDEIKKMLRSVINGQSAMKEELTAEIRKVKEEIQQNKKDTNSGFTRVNSRLNRIGKQLAYLEDDSPTREEFDNLDKRVKKIESKSIVISS